MGFSGGSRTGKDLEDSQMLDEGHLLCFAGCDLTQPRTKKRISPAFLDSLGAEGSRDADRGVPVTVPGASRHCFRDAFGDRLERRYPSGAIDAFLVVAVEVGRKQLSGLHLAAD